jgi:hypothetical protein
VTKRVKRLRPLSVLLLVTLITCGREPTDPSKSNLTGFWESFDRDLYITNIQMELNQAGPGVVVGKWRAIGKVDNSCPPGKFCTDSSIIQGRTEVAQVVLHLFGAGDFVGEQTKENELKGAIRSMEQNFHVTFTRH